LTLQAEPTALRLILPSGERALSKTDLSSFNGMIGVLEAVVDTAKRFQEFEERYRANETAFTQIQQKFQQMQEGATQLQSLTEERLAALSGLGVELKARHAQGEQTLTEIRGLVDQIRAQQANMEKGFAASETQRKAETARTAELAQTLGVVQTLIGKLQERQAQIEQSLVAVDALGKDRGKRNADQDKALGEVRAVADGVAERQARTEKAVAAVQAAQQADKNLAAHLEKALNTVRTMAVELEKRQAQIEATVVALKANGGDHAVNHQTVDAVTKLMKDIGDRQSAMTALMEETRQSAAKNAEEVVRVEQQVARLEKAGAEAVESSKAARDLASQALEKAAAAPAVAVPAGPIVQMDPKEQEKLSADFRTFVSRCDADHKASLERESKLQAQVRKTLETLPTRAEALLQKALEQNQGRMEKTVTGWLQQHEQRVAELEKRNDTMVSKIVETHRAMEKELSKAGAGAHAQPAIPPEWIQNVEALCAQTSAEVRFVKTLLWVSLAAVGLSYVLVAYAVILRSS
jgi:hypothetical protein